MPTSRKIKPPIPTEHDEQVFFFSRIALEYKRHPHWERLIFAVPNGGKRHIKTAMKLKAEGVKAGTPDILGLFPRSHYHGLIIEMKRKGNKPTPEQIEFMNAAKAQGYFVAVCYSGEEAYDVLKEYEKL